LDSPLMESADSLLDKLAGKKLTDAQAFKLSGLLPQSLKPVDIHGEIHSQYILLNTIRGRLLDENSQLLQDATAKEVQALMSQCNSFLSLYLRSMEKIDRDKELVEIEQAVTEAMRDCPKEVQDRYLERLKELLGV